jgi:hypothetical protein
MPRVNKIVATLDLPCEDEIKHFSSERTMNMWLKLHEKKCEKCRNAPMNEYKRDEGSIKVKNTDIALLEKRQRAVMDAQFQHPILN